MVTCGRGRDQGGIALVQARREATQVAQAVRQALAFGVVMVQLEGIGGRVGAPVQQVAVRAARLAGTGGARVVQAFWKGIKELGLINC